jgi:phage terminase small subunit
MSTQQIPNKPRPKLSRADIARGLENVPIAQVLIGAANAKTTRLTHKQAKFAQALALGESKAGAYRAAYDTQTNHHAQSIEGQRLAKHPSIAHQVDALRLAAEAKNYATPPALRQLVIERLTAHAIDDNINPSQRLRALELLGKITEVAAFTERREIVRVTDSATARDKLLMSLREVLQAQAIDVTPKLAPSNAVTLEPLDPPEHDVFPAGATPDENPPDDSRTPHTLDMPDDLPQSLT